MLRRLFPPMDTCCLTLATGLYSVAVSDDVPEYNPGTRKHQSLEHLRLSNPIESRQGRGLHSATLGVINPRLIIIFRSF